MKSYAQIKGFSLIEIAIALAVSGLLMSGIIQASRMNLIVRPIKTTETRFEIVEKAMQKFLAINGRLPCPSRPELDLDVSTGGQEVCDIASIPVCVNDQDTTASGGAGVCYAYDASKYGRDADKDSVYTDDKVVIGGIPYKALGISSENAVDGWNRKLRYAVSQRLTDLGSYDPDFGSIFVVNAKEISNYSTDITKYRVETLATGNEDFNASSPAPYGSAQFVLISSSINRAGAYVFSASGNLVGASSEKYKCLTSLKTPSEYFGLDFENCNQDKYFLTDDRYAIMNIDGTTDQYYYSDDLVHDAFTIEPYNDGMWGFSGFAFDYKLPASVVNASFLGRVGIGTDIPSVALDVNGNLTANKIYAKEICEGSKCFKVKMVSGNGSASCSKHAGFISGFDINGEPVCVNANFSKDLSCSSGYMFYGVDSSGNALCRTP